MAENFGGPVGVGVAVDGPAEGVGDAGVDWTGGAVCVGCAGRDVAVALHAATARQPTTAADARIRVANGELLTGRHPP
ncbi:hypothetical protein [Streptosporangium album]|uniref:hypothetical protein n=1 Tax=Streptosporangium album TaxID=47479 RepID=UPI001FEA9647|nr:hypothetical protein [Streptosporangium album]